MTETGTKTRERAKVTISGDSMSATLMLLPPQEGESRISADDINAAIEKAGIKFGLKEDEVAQASTAAEYNRPVLIAEGTKAKKGESTKFEYHFDTSNKHQPEEGDDGRIDYRNIHFIQNIEKGAILATRTPATPGIPGRTVRDKELKAPGGREIAFNKGANTEVSDDELTLTASASGAILYQHGKILVNDLTIINGDVDHQVGNIDCLGSVRVTGNVKAGYELKVDGDLEVHGHVEDAMLDVKGNILVKGGFFGKGDGFMKSGANVTIKYAEGQKIEAEGDITVGGEVINCDIMAKGNVMFQGAKGKIVGGETKAGKEITAAEIGSDAGTMTHLYVAFDRELMHRHADIQSELNRLGSDGERVKEGMYALYKLELAGKLPPDKKQVLQKLTKFQEELPASLATLNKEKDEVEAKLREYDDSKVIAKTKIYSGVTVHFGVVYKDIVDDHETCQLTIQDGKIMLSRA